MKEQIINLDIYRRSVVILQGSETELEDWLCGQDLKHLASAITDTDWETTKAITFDDDIDIYICAVKPMELPVLCHELSHATLRVLKIVGIDPIEAEEAYAYVFEYLISQVASTGEFLSPLSQDETPHTSL